MTTYIRVSDEEGGECIEIPVEDDGTLYLSTLEAQFPGACGLKYRNPDTKSLRGVKLIEERLICPDEGWIFDFFCTFPKADCKRKSSDILESSSSTKTKRLDLYEKCIDLIVLDLPYKTTEKDMKDYFSVYGNVVMAQLKKDPKTGESRGYGFIRFESLDVQKAVLAKRHMIMGRNCDVRVPKSKDPDNPFLSSKIFVGRITEDFTEQDLRDYFCQYGDVTYVFIPKKPFRAFSFVQFIEPRAAMEVCEQEEHIIKGVNVAVSSAKARKEAPKVPGGSDDLSGGNDFDTSGGGDGGFNNSRFSSRGGYGGADGGGGDGYYNGGRGGARGGGVGPIKRRGGGRNENFNGGGMGWNEHGAGGRGGVDPSGMNFNALAADVVAAITQQLGMGPPPRHHPPPPPRRHHY